MSTLGSILSNAGKALQAQQKATQVAGHNINNALTPGYSRQRAELTTAHPLQTPYGTTGGGVRLADITRARDSLLDSAFRKDSSDAEGYRLRYQLLGQLEASLLEFGEEGFSNTLDNFWNAWGDLANYPGNDAARVMVQSRGEQVASELNRLAAGVEDLRNSTAQRLEEAVDNLNSLGSRIADLNRQIIAAEAGGGTAADLRDSRDRALDELAILTPVQVVERQNGGIGVMVGGITLVDDAVARTLGTSTENDGVRVVRTDFGTPLEGTAGRIGALSQLLSTDLPRLGRQFDDLARGIAESVNELHRQGVIRDPVSGDSMPAPDFFGSNPPGHDIRAANIGLAPEVKDQSAYIAVGRPDSNGEYQVGKIDLALAIAGLREAPMRGGQPPGNGTNSTEKSLAGFYQEIVTGLGADINSARVSKSAHETLAQQAEIRRESVSGVSIDEEMVRLIQSQSAYQAAARVISAVDEMLQTVINLA